MSVAHLNVRSVASRENFYLVKRRATTNNFDIFTVSESWLNRTVCDADILILGYTTFRQDRGPYKRGGGVLVFSLVVNCHTEKLQTKVWKFPLPR